MIVCIAEKPSVAREIAKVLGASAKKDGYIEGNGYQVTWVFGHLCSLKEPEDYDPTNKVWSLDALPIIPPRFSIKLRSGDKMVAKQFRIIKSLVAKADYVINCGDAGQEGEVIQRWVLSLAGCKKPVLRLWISSMTDQAIREGVQNLRPSSDFDGLYNAGSLRAIGDWLLGMNASRAFTKKYAVNKTVLSLGRVQTPTLALVVKRAEEIENFVSTPYWELHTVYRGVDFISDDKKIDDKAKGQALLARVMGQPFFVTETKTANEREAPQRLYDLTTLQVEANRKYGMSADATLATAQSLYEKKLITYPRVDTMYLPDDMYPKIKGILSKLTQYSAYTQPLIGSPIQRTKRIFNNAKITDHHAIVPTGVQSSSLTSAEQSVYDMIVRRFIAAFYPDCVYSVVKTKGKVADVGFGNTQKAIKEIGWRALYPTKDGGAPEGIAPQLVSFAVGESGPHNPSLIEKHTEPPHPYTEATLLRAMETAGKTVDDEELRELMKDNGIGRPSTRAAIIETLFHRGYMSRSGKSLMPTTLGRQLISLIRYPLLSSASLTGEWEKKLRLIEKNQYPKETFMEELKAMTADVVNSVKTDTAQTKVEKEAQTFPTRNTKGASKGKRTKAVGKTPAKASDAKPTRTRRKTAKNKSEESNATSQIPHSPQFSPAPNPYSVRITDCVCPVCGRGRMLTGHYAWGCSEYRSGCMFRIPFVFNGMQLSESNAVMLLMGGSVYGITLRDIIRQNNFNKQQ